MTPLIVQLPEALVSVLKELGLKLGETLEPSVRRARTPLAVRPDKPSTQDGKGTN